MTSNTTTNNTTSSHNQSKNCLNDGLLVLTVVQGARDVSQAPGKFFLFFNLFFSDTNVNF